MILLEINEGLKLGIVFVLGFIVFFVLRGIFNK